jgi:hypothetical protein
MSLRRYTPLKASTGTRIPDPIRHRVARRDRAATGGCVGLGRLPGACEGALELDHVRASGGMGMKSVTCDCNLVQLCGAHHRYKTENGKVARPILLEYLARFEYERHEGHAV